MKKKLLKKIVKKHSSIELKNMTGMAAKGGTSPTVPLTPAVGKQDYITTDVS